jgi:hypothetical protein
MRNQMYVHAVCTCAVLALVHVAYAGASDAACLQRRTDMAAYGRGAASQRVVLGARQAATMATQFSHEPHTDRPASTLRKMRQVRHGTPSMLAVDP